MSNSALVHILICLLAVASLLLLISAHEDDQAHAHKKYNKDYFQFAYEELGLESGLAWDYYSESCPQVEQVLSETLTTFLEEDITQAAGLLRLHFHDCFVLGCDASILLVGNNSELTATPNLTLRSEALYIINVIKEALEEVCPSIVSCADIVALAARDSVAKAMGPGYPVLLGRRDNLVFANNTVVLASLPSPSSNISELLSAFAAVDLDATDLVALSGGHTIGIAHCPSFAERLDDPESNNLDETYAEDLSVICPSTTSTNFTNLDVITPNIFDNGYYIALAAKKGLLQSDSVLTLNSETNTTVSSFLSDQDLFFWQFGYSMIKMGIFGVLTGTDGEIRSNCSVANPSSYRDISSLPTSGVSF